MSIPKGPLGIDPVQFSVGLFCLLLLFVLYLLMPRALRKQYFGAYPRRHAWSARSRMRRSRGGYGQVSTCAVWCLGLMVETLVVSLVAFRPTIAVHGHGFVSGISGHWNDRNYFWNSYIRYQCVGISTIARCRTGRRPEHGIAHCRYSAHRPTVR